MVFSACYACSLLAALAALTIAGTSTSLSSPIVLAHLLHLGTLPNVTVSSAPPSVQHPGCVGVGVGVGMCVCRGGVGVGVGVGGCICGCGRVCGTSHPDPKHPSPPNTHTASHSSIRLGGYHPIAKDHENACIVLPNYGGGCYRKTL